jgi:hypothetical protein
VFGIPGVQRANAMRLDECMRLESRCDG